MIRVVVVDDQAVVRSGFRTILESEMDIEVVGEAADGADAVIEARRTRPDVVLMDVRMPRVNGITATAQLAGPDVADPVAVLVVTTFDLDEYVFSAWLGEPTWPISEGWGKPMRFVCQIALDGRLASVFLTHADHDDPDFFDPDVIFPDGGENAVIVQPDGHHDGLVSTSATGPTLYLEDGSPAEFTVDLQPRAEPDFLPQKQYTDLPAEEQGRYYDAVSGNKIGGTPAFFQGDDWPDDGPWQLLLQLDTNDVPFYLNLGSAPIAFAFVSPDGLRGRLLVQDS